MIKLFVVALLHCTAGDCTPEPLEEHVYYSEEDCTKAAGLLSTANPGMSFNCGTVIRRMDQ